LADIALLRDEPGLYRLVASDATVSRTITALAGAAPSVLAAIDTARAVARKRAWKLAGLYGPGHGVSARTPLNVAGWGGVSSRILAPPRSPELPTW
jgi:hypothetical protein